MNTVILMGRLVRDPDIRYTSGATQMAIARFALAIDRRIKKEGAQNADFPTIVAYGKTAEFVEKYVHKGTKLVVRGRIQTGSYKDRDGKTVYTTDVIAEDVEFAESKKSDGSGAVEYTAPVHRNEEPAVAKAQGDAGEAGFLQIPDDVSDESLPFN